jgi:hypothetical protein
MGRPSVIKWLENILSKDAAAFEDAYWGDRPSSHDAMPRILEALKAEQDPYTRGKLIELLGESGDMSVLPMLEKELSSPDQSLRDWADAGIQALRRGEPWQKNPKYL